MIAAKVVAEHVYDAARRVIIGDARTEDVATLVAWDDERGRVAMLVALDVLEIVNAHGYMRQCRG